MNRLKILISTFILVSFFSIVFYSAILFAMIVWESLPYFFDNYGDWIGIVAGFLIFAIFVALTYKNDGP